MTIAANGSSIDFLFFTMGLFQLLGGSLTCGSSFRNRTLRLRSTLGSRNYRSWLRRFLRGWSSGPWAGPCSSDGLSSFPPTKSLKVRSWKVKKNGSSMFGERDRGWWMLKKKVNYFGFQFRRCCKVSLSPRPGKVVDLDGFSKPGLWGHVPR